MNTSGRKERLRNALSDKEYRDAFVAAQANVGIPFQIRALREREPWTQKEFAEKAGMKQSWISKIENPGYSGFSLKTLLKLASVFDVGLVVRFVPIGQLVEWELNLSNNSLEVPSFSEDPYFREEGDIGSSLSKLTAASQEASSKVIVMSRATPVKHENMV